MFNPAMFESMKHMMDGNMMKKSAEMMSKMSDEELKAYANMTGMNIDPAMLRSASSNMAKMDESTLESMKNTAAPRFPPQTSTPSVSSPPAPKALDLKNQGNEFFKAGKIPDAKKKYLEGIKEIESLPLDQANTDLEVTLRMNLAACLVKEEDFDAVIVQCKKSLLLGDNPKAFYRYGQALYKLGSESKALEYLEKAFKLSPNDANISGLLNEVRNAVPAKVEEVKTEKVETEEKSEAKPEPVRPKPVIVDQPKDRGVDLDIKPEKPKEKIKEKPEKIKEKPEKPVETLSKPAERPPASPADLKLPNLSPEQMNKGLEDLKNMSPSTIAQMASTLKSMDPRLMQEVFKSQGINMPPEQIAKMAEMLTPETIQMMTSSFANRGQSTGEAGVTQPAAPDVASMLSNPEFSKMASQMLSQQLGKQPEDIQVILNCLGKMMKVFGKIFAAYNFLMAGRRKYFTVGGVVLVFSYWLGFI